MIKRRVIRLLRSTRPIQWMSIALLIGVLIFNSVALAQQVESAAPVVIDEQELFQVSELDQLTAEERATIINNRLEKIIQSTEPVQVRVVQENNLPTIQINGRQLLTITEPDVSGSTTPKEQARQWASDLQQAIEQAQKLRSPEHLRNSIILSLWIVAIALLLNWALGRFWNTVLRPFIQMRLSAFESSNEPQDPHSALGLFLSLVLTALRTALWLGVIRYVTDQFLLTRQWSYRITNELITSVTAPILQLGDVRYSIIQLSFLIGMLFLAIILSKTITDLIKLRILRITGVNRGAQEAVAIIIRYMLIGLSVIVLLQIWGLDISSLAILISALGVGVGIGLQEIAKNFASGLVLVFERPIQVGDFVEVGEFQGTVERIGARSTLIRTLDQVSIIVPNSRFLESEVINWSHDNPISRLHLPVGVAYGSNVEEIRQVLIQSAKDHSGVLSTPPPQVFFKGFGDSSLDFELLVWIAEPNRQLKIKSDLYFSIERMLRQHEVEIPFPQRDINFRNSALPIEISPQLEQLLKQFLRNQ